MSEIRRIDQLILFEAARNDKVVRSLADLAYAAPDETPKETILQTYYETQRALIDHVGHGEISGNYLQNHFCLVLAGEQNVFARMAENGAFKHLKRGMSAAVLETALDFETKSVLKLAASEIKLISAAYRFDFMNIISANDGRNVAAAPAGSRKISHREMVHKAMTQNRSIDAAILLANYYHSYGSGIFEASPALNAEETGLVPVSHMDPIAMDDLVGYENQKRMLLDNVNILLSGLRANNVLLYGDSGTGKSSSVKALLNMHASKGLKMICVTKDKIGLLPDVLARIEGRGIKFIIFIDDLSFEENEHEYKLFKSIIEGRATPRPQNAIFIVTTNRKNIVKEVWNDREGSDDVRRRDNMQEKRSLSDRFGITLIYSEPSKQEYLAIVRSLARNSGLDMPEEQLVFEALKWEIRHGGRSGRTARQFVDYMIGIQTVNKGTKNA